MDLGNFFKIIKEKFSFPRWTQGTKNADQNIPVEIPPRRTFTGLFAANEINLGTSTELIYTTKAEQEQVADNTKKVEELFNSNELTKNIVPSVRFSNTLLLRLKGGGAIDGVKPSKLDFEYLIEDLDFLLSECARLDKKCLTSKPENELNDDYNVLIQELEFILENSKIILDSPAVSNFLNTDDGKDISKTLQAELTWLVDYVDFLKEDIGKILRNEPKFVRKPLRLTGGGVEDYGLKSPKLECSDLLRNLDGIVKSFKETKGPCGAVMCPFAPSLVTKQCTETCPAADLLMDLDKVELIKPNAKGLYNACGSPACPYTKYKSGLLPDDVIMEMQFLECPKPGEPCAETCPYLPVKELPPIHWDCPDPLPKGKCKNPNCPLLPKDLKKFEKTINEEYGIEVGPFDSTYGERGEHGPFLKGQDPHYDKKYGEKGEQGPFLKGEDPVFDSKYGQKGEFGPFMEGKDPRFKEYGTKGEYGPFGPDKDPHHDKKYGEKGEYGPWLKGQDPYTDKKRAEKAEYIPFQTGKESDVKGQYSSSYKAQESTSSESDEPVKKIRKSSTHGTCDDSKCPANKKNKKSKKDKCVPECYSEDESNDVCGNPDCPYVLSKKKQKKAKKGCDNPCCPAKNKPKTQEGCSNPCCPAKMKSQNQGCSNPCCPAKLEPKEDACSNPCCPVKLKSKQQKTCANPCCPAKEKRPGEDPAEPQQAGICNNPCCPARPKDVCYNPNCPFAKAKARKNLLEICNNIECSYNIYKPQPCVKPQKKPANRNFCGCGKDNCPWTESLFKPQPQNTDVCDNPHCPVVSAKEKADLKKGCSNPCCPFAPKCCGKPACPASKPKTCDNPCCPSKPKVCDNPCCPFAKPKTGCDDPNCPAAKPQCSNENCPAKKVCNCDQNDSKAQQDVCDNPECPFALVCTNPDCPANQDNNSSSSASDCSCGRPGCPYSFSPTPSMDICGNPDCQYADRGKKKKNKQEPCDNPDCPFQKELRERILNGPCTEETCVCSPCGVCMKPPPCVCLPPEYPAVKPIDYTKPLSYRKEAEDVVTCPPGKQREYTGVSGDCCGSGGVEREYRKSIQGDDENRPTDGVKRDSVKKKYRESVVDDEALKTLGDPPIEISSDTRTDIDTSPCFPGTCLYQGGTLECEECKEPPAFLQTGCTCSGRSPGAVEREYRKSLQGDDEHFKTDGVKRESIKKKFRASPQDDEALKTLGDPPIEITSDTRTDIDTSPCRPGTCLYKGGALECEECKNAQRGSGKGSGDVEREYRRSIQGDTLDSAKKHAQSFEEDEGAPCVKKTFPAKGGGHRTSKDFETFDEKIVVDSKGVCTCTRKGAKNVPSTPTTVASKKITTPVYRKKGKKLGKYVYSIGDEYPGLHVGHRRCLNQGFLVPPNQGWLWNVWTPCLSLKPRRGWKPGAIGRTIAGRIAEHRAKQGLNVLQLPKFFKGFKVGAWDEDGDEPVHVEPKPTLQIKKQGGAYFITMNPLKDPHKLAPNENPYLDCTPMKFKIVKNKPPKEKREGEYIVDGEDAAADNTSSSSSDSELDIEFTPPAGIIDPTKFKKLKNVVHIDTQYDSRDIAVEKKKGKKGKNNKEKKGGKKGGKGKK